jgi:hypothetical protein
MNIFNIEVQYSGRGIYRCRDLQRWENRSTGEQFTRICQYRLVHLIVEYSKHMVIFEALFYLLLNAVMLLLFGLLRHACDRDWHWRGIPTGVFRSSAARYFHDSGE